MTDKQRQHLVSLRDTLTVALDNINKMLSDDDKCKLEEMRGTTVSLPDSFSEDKEKFLAP